MKEENDALLAGVPESNLDGYVIQENPGSLPPSPPISPEI